MADRIFRWWVWEPRQLNWWIAVLFMIGSALFGLGCALFLTSVKHELLLDSTFFAGSIFFTSAAYCQLHQARSANKFVFGAALTQFIGTLMFNANTFDAFFDLGWLAQDLLVWTPNILGSILFQISASLAMKDLCKNWWCWDFSNPDWQMGLVNFAGCIAFLVSAILSFAPSLPVSPIFGILATTFTLIGACCFFAGAFLMLPGTKAHQE